MRIPIALAAVALALLGAGCASDKPGQPENGAASSSSTPTPEPVTLRETCPEIEAALPGGYLPDADQVTAFLGDLQQLQEDGDTETKNAIELLRPATVTYRDAMATGGPADKLDAHRAWLGAISAVADRCKAAGSSALQ